MRFSFYLASFFSLLALTGCMNTSTQSWEDFKTMGRYMHREMDALFGNEHESRLLSSNDDFVGPDSEEFIPLKDSDLHKTNRQFDPLLPQSKAIPGQKGVPLLSEFYPAPESVKSFFRPVHFDTDEYIVKDRLDVEGLSKLAAYLKEHSNVYLFVEGHCDERASAGYNMALGLRRANCIRSFLVKQGVDLNRIFTASRGKEQPLALGHNPDDWKANRRSEFKMYAK
ncbi:MAG TPA: OmpA family protein [Chlamydiales bacterium]|nr:MAG: hypothetical protein A3F67_03730 [Verrucomicrobia bacterium RIFCSPHIGHO2_12_FULL_41_10]HLB52333.1 OmpA family protein [Chlamydiales bacterium]